MADYRELLRRAISALPENNGAARRAVYEKARTALVGQLRAITPPLPARDITQHRLQLEDCIRQVEHEASEAVISLGRDSQQASRAAASGTFTPRPPVAPERAAPPPNPAFVAPPEPRAEVASTEPEVAPAEDQASAHEEPMPRPPGRSIEEIIAEAAAATGAEVTASDVPPTSTPAETADVIPIPPRRPEPVQPAPRPSFFAPRRETSPPALAAGAEAASAQAVSIDRLEPSLGSTALARQPATEPVVINPPLPVEPGLGFGQVAAESEASEAQGAIERAIETLDREARGETSIDTATTETVESLAPTGRSNDTAFAAADAETRSGAGLTIFLVVFALLLVGVGGAGYWAWREGYVDLDQMFGGQTSTVEQAQNTQTTVPTMDSPSADLAAGEDSAVGPGNTATNQASEPSSALQGLEAEERLTPEPVTPTGTETTLPSIDNGEIKTEERLSGSDTTIAAADDPAASVDPANLAGNQSLLLEASADGRSGAVPFSGTVEWSEGTDEIGGPTLIGRASIPARNLGVNLTIRRNNDPVLPASHLMEISFDVPDTFIGGSVATLAGVLLKDQELVPGTALTGAAARVVGNSFLFALSANEADVTANTQLLDQRRWIDLAVVYGTGRNAILTLEKDEEAQVLFDRVLAAWAE